MGDDKNGGWRLRWFWRYEHPPKPKARRYRLLTVHRGLLTISPRFTFAARRVFTDRLRKTIRRLFNYQIVFRRRSVNTRAATVNRGEIVSIHARRAAGLIFPWPAEDTNPSRLSPGERHRYRIRAAQYYNDGNWHRTMRTRRMLYTFALTPMTGHMPLCRVYRCCRYSALRRWPGHKWRSAKNAELRHQQATILKIHYSVNCDSWYDSDYWSCKLAMAFGLHSTGTPL